ncbi:CaiB/BaiF CoA transferase family protein [Azospirillum soli]|uniref:CaiB/BaiF CoA transferase family protein n=1 Tax=Azospirillum soli TaxID=1304799 RepID=UPI001AE664A3|nr:CaiB/BaiF CoA-transferase family protein [Azospirillum soli]MBP2314323.1 CoA:oxalate CoA-transferase [Azospirillum soli]
MPSTDTQRRDAPLAGVRVVDLTHMLAGPYSTWLLGALGADVIKIERPGKGDFTRVIAPFSDEESIYFLSVNRNKRSLTLNLKEEKGKEIFKKIVSTCDVLVENNRAGAMDRLGLGYADLKAVNERLIYASISGFGQSGPYRHRPCFDVVAQAMSGMMSITGEPGGDPCRVGASIGDIGSSLFAAIGILAALQKRASTGEGSFIDVAMLDCQLALMENAIARYLNAGETPRALGNRHPLIAPFQAFATTDNPIAVCVDTNEQWERMCRAMGLEHLLADPRFPTGSARNSHHAELEPLLKEVFLTRDRDTWLDILEEADVPASPINSVPDALADPQVIHRKMVVEVPEGSGKRFAAVPITMPEAPLPAEAPAPRLGEHTGEILAELGFSPAEIDAFRRDAVV